MNYSVHSDRILSQVFYGREDTLERIKNYMLGDSEKPLVLFGEGGCGKTSLLAKSAGLTSSIWLTGKKPISIIRYLGTTPDSSALTPTLISICQQVSIAYIILFSTLKDGNETFLLVFTDFV